MRVKAGYAFSFLVLLLNPGVNTIKPESFFANLYLATLPSPRQWASVEARSFDAANSEPELVLQNFIELVSARVIYKESMNSKSEAEKMKVWFYLPSISYLSDVHITAQAKRGSSHQTTAKWPKVVPNNNIQPVLNILGEDGIDDRNRYVIVREGKEPKPKERVAPVALYRSHPPEVTRGYAFTFKVSQASLLVFTFQPAGILNPKPLCRPKTIPSQTQGIPAVAKCDKFPDKPGEYELITTGYVLKTKTSFSHSVTFYHQPVTKDK